MEYRETWVQIPVLSVIAVHHCASHLTSLHLKCKIQKNHLPSQLWVERVLGRAMPRPVPGTRLAAWASSLTPAGCSALLGSWCSAAFFTSASDASRAQGTPGSLALLTRVPLPQYFAIPSARQSRRGANQGLRGQEPGSGAGKGAWVYRGLP